MKKLQKNIPKLLKTLASSAVLWYNISILIKGINGVLWLLIITKCLKKIMQS